MRAFLAAALVTAGLLTGCGSSHQEQTPAACLVGAGGYVKALRAAPGPVRLAGETQISACLPADQAPGDQAQVGSSLVRTATVLNVAARRDPGSRANVSLGYLVGAVDAGTAGGSGIQTDLVRRIQVAARYDGGRPPAPAFDVAYAKGYAAGRSAG